MERSRRRAIGGAALAVFMAMAQVRVVMFVLNKDYVLSVDAALGVLAGRPHWRIFQSRVLGPYLVLGLSKILSTSDLPPPNDFLVAHVLYSTVTIAVAGYLAFRLGAFRLGTVQYGDLRAGLLALALFELTFACLLSSPWLYAWDYLEVISFLVFVDFVLAERTWPWFALLYLVSVFNRDSAQFIALWMILDPLCRWGLGRLRLARDVSFDWKLALAGLVLIPIGIGIGELLRRALFIEETGPRIFLDALNAGQNALFWNVLPYNLERIRSAIGGILVLRAIPAFPVVVPIFWMATIVLALALAWHYPARLLGLGLVYCAMAVAEILFGMLFETRTLLYFIPLVVVAGLFLTGVPGPGELSLGELWRRRGKSKI